MSSLKFVIGLICLAPALAMVNYNAASSSSSPWTPPVTGSGVPSMWAPFYWNQTGSWQGNGTITYQILYPFHSLSASSPNYFAIDTTHKVFKYNFTTGGSQKTNASGTWITFAPGGQCYHVANWTYEIQILTYTYATFKKALPGRAGIWTGAVEDVSSCATTVATTFYTVDNFVKQWDFAGGYEISGQSFYFDYVLTYDHISSSIPPTTSSYWNADASCNANVSALLCTNLFPDGCESFLKGFHPTPASPTCNCTGC